MLYKWLKVVGETAPAATWWVNRSAQSRSSTACHLEGRKRLTLMPHLLQRLCQAPSKRWTKFRDRRWPIRRHMSMENITRTLTLTPEQRADCYGESRLDSSGG